MAAKVCFEVRSLFVGLPAFEVGALLNRCEQRNLYFKRD